MYLLKQFMRLATAKTPRAQRMRRIAKLIFVIALFAVLFWIVPIQKVVGALLSANLSYLLIGLVFSLLSTTMSAVELEPLVRTQGISRTMPQILGINLAVKFYSQFMPGSIVGSALRWYRLAHPGGKAPEALAAMAFFRLLELFLDISMGLIFWIVSQQTLVHVNLLWPALLVIGVPLLWIGVTRLSLPAYAWVKDRTQAIWQRPALNRPVAWLESFLQAVAAFSRTPARDLLFSVLAGVVSLLLGVTSNYFFARAVGIDLPFLIIGWIYAILVLATQLPFAFAGGLGIREVTLLAIMPGLGVSAELALAYSFLIFIRGLVISLTGGLTEAISIFVLKKPASLEAVRRKES